MVSRRTIERLAATEQVDLLFYQIIEKKETRMLKPLKINTKAPLKLVRAIADNTIILTFYDTLARDLRAKGVAPGSRIQVRAKFTSNHEIVDPVLKGTIVLCEVDV
ncbi:hypothetical protein JXA56_02995 [Candidatus Micrarchaeota archaeon]|nr:hypothetical protein [Candidatus Micrarchaeota archaeon]